MPSHFPYEDTTENGEPSEKERDKYRQKPYVYKDPPRSTRWHVTLFLVAGLITVAGLAFVTYVVPGWGLEPRSNAWGTLFLIALFGPVVGACVIELMFGRE